MSNDDDTCNENNKTEKRSDDNHQHSAEHDNDSGKKSVHFTSPVEQVFYFDGVTEEERDSYWFRRTDYIEFVESELRRRELLNEIEFSSGNPEDAKKTHQQQRRASTGPDSGTSHNTAEEDPTKSATETAMKHTFTRRMVGRTFSSGPPRRRRLPRRERNELDVCQHQSQLAKVKKAAEAATAAQQQQQQQQPSSSSSAASKSVESQEKTIALTKEEQQLQPASNSENIASPASSPPLATTTTTTTTTTTDAASIINITENSGSSTLNNATSASTVEKNQSGSEDDEAQNSSSKSKTAEPSAMSGDDDQDHDDEHDHDKNGPTTAIAIAPGPSPTQALAV